MLTSHRCVGLFAERSDRLYRFWIMRFALCLVCSSFLVLPVKLAAESSVSPSQFPSTVKSLATAAEQDRFELAAANELARAALNEANAQLDKVEDGILSKTNFTHLDIRLGSDSFALDTGTKTKTEIISTLRLRETANGFLFNQTSIVDFDDRTTVNFGLGYRNINDADTVIIGINGFYDYELDAKHRRTGMGVEYLTSLAEFRYNSYKAQSNTRLHKGINESALDGNDYKLTANLPYFYASDVYYNRAKWKDGAGYKVTQKEWGLTAEIIPNVTMAAARQQTNSGKRSSTASISYAIPLGGPALAPREMQDGSWTTRLKPIRDQLYRPVERENRIMKKALKLGVVVSGY
jgi:hypothetical protein